MTLKIEFLVCTSTYVKPPIVSMWLVAAILDHTAMDGSIIAERFLGHHRSTVSRRSLPSDFM